MFLIFREEEEPAVFNLGSVTIYILAVSTILLRIISFQSFWEHHWRHCVCISKAYNSEVFQSFYPRPCNLLKLCRYVPTKLVSEPKSVFFVYLFKFFFDTMKCVLFSGSKCHRISENHWCFGRERKPNSLRYMNRFHRHKANTSIDSFFFSSQTSDIVVPHRTISNKTPSGTQTRKVARIRSYIQMSRSGAGYRFIPQSQRSVRGTFRQEGCKYTTQSHHQLLYNV